MADSFPLDTEENEQRFMQLDEAYIAARYNPEFTMDPKDLEILTKCVRTLLDRAKAACEVELERM